MEGDFTAGAGGVWSHIFEVIPGSTPQVVGHVQSFNTNAYGGFRHRQLQSPRRSQPSPAKYAASVQNETAMSVSGNYDGCILRKKNNNRIEMATNASVRKEMAQPRVAKSARILQLELRTVRRQKHPPASDSP